MDNSSAAGQPLMWRQDGTFSQQYLLHSGNEVIANLKLEDIFGRIATLASSAGSFALKAEGYFGRHIRIYDASNNTEVARFESNLTGGHGVLEFPDGRQYGWAKISFWLKRYAFEDKNGSHLMVLQEKGMMPQGCEVKVAQPLPMPELIMLAGFGWYQMIMAMTAQNAAIGANYPVDPKLWQNSKHI